MNQRVVIRHQLDRVDFIFTKMATARWGMNRILSREQVGTGTQPNSRTEIIPAIFRFYFPIMATLGRSEERRVGKEGRSRRGRADKKRKMKRGREVLEILERDERTNAR